MTLSEVKDLVIFMKNEGVCSFDVEGIKVSFDPRSFPEANKAAAKEALKETLSSMWDDQKKMSQEEEDLLFASAT